MSTGTKTKDNFKPVLLFLDEHLRKKLIDRYNTNLEITNSFLSECETLLGRELTKAEINKAVKNPLEFSEHVKTLVKSKFQFPQASTEFNLQAVGLSFGNLETALSMLSNEPLKSYIIDNGELIPEPKHIDTLTEQAKIKTRNTKQNELLKIAKDLKKHAERLKELQVAFISNEFHYGKATGQLITNTWGVLDVNYQKILSYQ